MPPWCTAGVSNTILSAAGALFLDESGRVLLVEPNYKDYWEIPGGLIEVGETPSQGCAQGDRVLFVFDGGVLTAPEIATIHLQAEELDSYEFLTPEQALDRLIPRLRRRVAAALQARAESRTLYLEHGIPY
jgi:8-oxo-dGTP diphosphatase